MEHEPQDCSPSCEQNNKEDGEEKCVWYIESPEHNNCLWNYIQANSAPDGSMAELVQSQIASLLGWSNTKTHFALKQANLELVEALKKYHAQLLIPGGYEDINETTISVIDAPDSTEDSED